MTLVARAGRVTKGTAPIKTGSAGGSTAGQRFPQSVREQAFHENPSRTCVFCRREGTGTQVEHAIPRARGGNATIDNRSEEHTSELQSRGHLVCRRLLEKKKQQ